MRADRPRFIATIVPGLFLAALVAGCAAAVRDGDGPDAGAVKPDLAAGQGGRPDLASTDLAVPPGGNADLADNPPGCDPAARWIYTIDKNQTFSAFKPDTLQFTDMGKLDCPTSEPGATPFSMAVDRGATAWVLYNDGELFKVDANTVKCTATTFTPPFGFSKFGMAFVSNSVHSTDETLFVAGPPDVNGVPGLLGTLDTATLKIAKLKQLPGVAELTGTGDAKLWAFFPDAKAPRIGQIDKMTAAESGKLALPGIAGPPQSWAFAFWGAQYWVFLKRMGEASTQVYRVKADGTLSTAVPNTGRTIVGAGVSTCAPDVPIG